MSFASAHCSCCADGLRVPEVENLLGSEVVDNAATRRGVDRLGEEPVVIAAAIGEEYDVLARLGERPLRIVHVKILDLDLPRPYKLCDAADMPLEVLHGRDRIDLEPKATVVKPCNAGLGVASCGNDVVHVPLEPHVFFSSLLCGSRCLVLLLAVVTLLHFAFLYIVPYCFLTQHVVQSIR